MTYDNRQLVHVWAQQSKDSGRTGTNNLSFVGRSLYSYRTEIARFIEGRAVYTSHTYSVTTSGKHQNQIPGAVSHLESYRTALEMREIPDTWGAAAPLLFIDMLRDLKASVTILMRGRMNVAARTARLIEDSGAAHRFYLKYLASMDPADFNVSAEDRITLTDLLAIVAPIGKTVDDILKERFGADLKAQREREREANAKRREAQKIAEAKRAEEERAAITEWRAGNNSRMFHSVPVMLRINGDEIETSRGARIPISNHTFTLWRCIKEHGKDSNRLINGMTLGDFTVNRFDGDTLHVGCHAIPLTELQQIAVALGYEDGSAIQA